MHISLAKRLAVLTTLYSVVVPTFAHKYYHNDEVCAQIMHYKNVSRIGYTIYKVNPATTIEAIKNTFKLSTQSILESSGLRYPLDETIPASCLILPEKEGMIKIANSAETLDYLLTSFGVSRAKFSRYNEESPLFGQGKPIVFFLPIIPSEKITRKYVFPVIGAILIKAYKNGEVDPFTGLAIRPSIHLVGKKYATDVLAIDAGIVSFPNHSTESSERSEYFKLGDRIVTEHKDGLKVFYQFSGSVSVKNGDKINKGAVIGKYQSNGHLYLVRLRIEKNNKSVDPMSLFLQ